MKTKILFLTLTGLFSGLLAGCNEKNITVEEFQKKPDLAKQYENKCINGELNPDSVICQNASHALELNAMGVKIKK